MMKHTALTKSYKIKRLFENCFGRSISEWVMPARDKVQNYFKCIDFNPNRILGF